MEVKTIAGNVKVFGFPVKTFPHGIEAAFDGLVKMLPPGDARYFYGISECIGEGILYKAAALETYDGEAAKYGCDSYMIEKGDYLTVTLTEWRHKTDQIKTLLDALLKDERSDSTRPCIEIYKSDVEMECMVRMDQRKAMLNELSNTTKELVQLLSSFNQAQINTVPFEGSWTAAQVGEHIHKSNEGMIKMLYGPVKPTVRDPAQHVTPIKNMLLDVNQKFHSDASIIPANMSYDKEDLITVLLQTGAQISEALNMGNLTETCTLFSFRVFGELTKQEVTWFMIYHMQRHIHQISNIAQAVKN